jgi:hypothetical protein
VQHDLAGAPRLLREPLHRVVPIHAVVDERLEPARRIATPAAVERDVVETTRREVLAVGMEPVGPYGVVLSTTGA